MVGRSVRLSGAFVSLALLAGAWGVPAVMATSAVITNCSDDNQLTDAINNGDSITFNCGTATIVLGGVRTVSKNVTIDGGDKITLSGAGTHHLFTVNGAGASLDLKHIVLKKGHAVGNGGAIMNLGGFLALENATIKGSSATGNGGAIYSTGDMDIIATTFSGNSALNGGAIYASGSGASVTLSTSLLHDNNPSSSTSGQSGGAIYVDTGTTLNVHSSYLYSNEVGPGGLGGALFNKGTASLESTTIDSNSTGNSGDGGGIYNQGSLTLTNDTLTRNTGYAFGGGLYNNGTATLINVTISGNSEITDNGGGINNQNASVLRLTNVLFSHNTNDNCRFVTAPATSLGNLSSDGTCGFGSGRDNIVIKLGPLETNGGQTPTERLLPGSAAINDGTSTGAPGNDQRGVSRPQPSAGMTDVGAVEFVPCSGLPTSPPTLLAPASGATLKTTQPVLDWYGPDCATSFKVTVRRGSSTGTVVFSKSVFPASQVKTSSLAHGHIYFWTVKGCDSAGCVTSSMGNFKVP